jgi:hypothetical protein
LFLVADQGEQITLLPDATLNRIWSRNAENSPVVFQEQFGMKEVSFGLTGMN